MVLERVFDPKEVRERPLVAQYMGVVYVLLSFIVSNIIWRHSPLFVGVSTIILALVLTLPTLRSFLRSEEKALEKSSHLAAHRPVIIFYLHFFIGVFLTFFVLSLAFPDAVMSETQLNGKDNEIATLDVTLPPPPSLNGESELWIILRNNLLITFVCFLLSIMYASGGLLLILIHASIFSHTIAAVITAQFNAAASLLSQFSLLFCHLSVLSLHMIPEMVAYFIAAVAGGIFAKSLIHHHLHDVVFRRGLKTGTALLALAGVFLVLGSLTEVYLSKTLIMAQSCLSHANYSVLLFFVLVAIIFVLDYFRRRSKGSFALKQF